MDYRVDIKVRNGRILRRMNKRGIYTVNELGRRLGMKNGPSILGDIINMKILPYGTRGDWRSAVYRMADFFGCMPEDLFSEDQLIRKLESNKAYLEMSQEELTQLMDRQEQRALPSDEIIQRREINETLAANISELSQRHQIILTKRYGLGDEKVHTLDELAEILGVTRERIRQIETKALMKLRTIASSEKLAEAGEQSAADRLNEFRAEKSKKWSQLPD